MLARLERASRVVGTALAFSAFGLGGLLLWLLYFPLLALLVRDPQRRVPYARATVSRSFALFIELMRVLRLHTYEIHGVERLQRSGLLILANHPTLIDVVYLISLVRNADCVVKASLATNPFTRGPVAATGYIPNTSGPELLEACMNSLHRGGNLIIFPEGTRSRPGQRLRMQRGAAQIATRMPCAVTPVHIRCVPLSLTKGLPWWQVPPSPMHFIIRVGEDITVEPFLEGATGEPGLAARHLTSYLQNFFTEPQGSA